MLQVVVAAIAMLQVVVAAIAMLQVVVAASNVGHLNEMWPPRLPP
jgi:hypothetical protein